MSSNRNNLTADRLYALAAMVPAFMVLWMIVWQT